MTVPRPSSQSGLGRLRGAFTERLGLKATAILLSLLLWLVVGARAPTESYVEVAVLPALDSSLVLLDDPPQVRALVTGRAADLIKLYASPPIVRRQIAGDAPDTLVLDLVPADVHIPPELSDAIHVLDVQPRSVMLRFEARASRRVAVMNDGRVLVGGRRGAIVFEPVSVRVTGPRAAVRRVITLRPQPLAIADGDTLTHLADLDTAGLGVRVRPAQVRVRARYAGAPAPPSVLP